MNGFFSSARRNSNKSAAADPSSSVAPLPPPAPQPSSSSTSSGKFPFSFCSARHSHPHHSSSTSSSSSSCKLLPSSARHLPQSKNAKMLTSNGTGAANGLPKKTVASSPALSSFVGNGTTSSPFLLNADYVARRSSLSPRMGSTVEDISLGDLFRLIARMRICVVRRVGSDVDGQVRGGRGGLTGKLFILNA